MLSSARSSQRWRGATASSYAGSARFRSKIDRRELDVIHAPALMSRWKRNPYRFSRPARKCASGSIALPPPRELLSLSIGFVVASGQPLLQWNSARPRKVLYVDGEMPIASLQERLKGISIGLGGNIPSDRFRMLAADQVEGGINLSNEEGQCE